VNHFALPSRVAIVATLPSALFGERFCSLGASWVFSFQSVLPPDFRPLVPSTPRTWARPWTQSPELGALGFCFFLPKKILTYAAAGIATWWQFRNGS
jgi:hypothetical protein